MPDRLELSIFGKDFGFLDDVADPRYGTLTARFLSHDSGEFQLRADDPVTQSLQVNGCRYVAQYRGVFSSGRVLTPRFGLGPAADITYQLKGDYSVFEDTLAYVNPGNRITPADLASIAQAWQTGTNVPGTVEGQVGYYRWPDSVSSAESAIKNLIQVNLVDWLGRPVTVLPNLDRGGDARLTGMLPNVRFTSVAEALRPLLDWSGLGLRAWQEPDGDTILVDVWEPAEYGQELDVATGTLADGSGTLGYPELTRVLVMGPGDLAGRAFELVVDEELEEEFGYVIEVAKDATSAGIEWPESLSEKFRVPAYFTKRPEITDQAKAEFLTYLRTAASEALFEGRPVNGLNVDLVSTDTFHLGGDGGYQVGDRVIVEAHGQEFEERITSATVSVDTSGQVTATPALGSVAGEDEDDEAAAVWGALGSISKRMRGLAAQR